MRSRKRRRKEKTMMAVVKGMVMMRGNKKRRERGGLRRSKRRRGTYGKIKGKTLRRDVMIRCLEEGRRRVSTGKEKGFVMLPVQKMECHGQSSFHFLLVPLLL